MASTIVILPAIPAEDSLEEVLSVNEGLLLCSRNAA